MTEDTFSLPTLPPIDEKLIADLISIHNAENWLGLDEDGLGPVQPGSIIGQNIQLREPEGMGEGGNIIT